MDFIRDDDYMQYGISDLTACFNKEFLCKAVTDQAAKSKISTEAGIILCDGFNENDDKMFESSASHADKPKGITTEQLSKVWRVSNEVAQQTLDMTTHFNK